MSINQNELFFRGYNPAVWYPGYDENWILGRAGPTKSQQGGGSEKQTLKGIIELKMPLCCEGCVEKVNKKLKAMQGVASVDCNTDKQKVTVRGDAKPEAVLAKAKKISPRAEFWKEKK